ncbi:ATPase family AAA domain-containing protein 2-like isoform X1 [Cloeon dipterum]|uniref:ATPase family AAA domain-containing protein 2-like isoform X1 n=1 Tax=Cloeon dipterum TaxID=197152 RepID=UPI00321FDD0E
MVKTRRGDSTLDDSEMPGLEHDRADSDEDDEPIFSRKRRSKRHRESPIREISERRREHSMRPVRTSTRFVLLDKCHSSEDSDDERSRAVEDMNTEDSSPIIRHKGKRQRRKLILEEPSSGDEVAMPRRPLRRMRGHKYSPSKSFALRSISNGDSGLRRSGRERKLRYSSFNDSWILEGQDSGSYHRRLRRDSSVGRRILRTRMKVEADDDEEGEDMDVEEEPTPRRSSRRVRIKDDDDDEDAEAAGKEQKEKEDDKTEENNETNEEENKDDEEEDDENKAEEGANEDMYTRVKRQRRGTRNNCFNKELRSLRQSNHIITSGDESGSSDDNQRPSSPRKGYHLRQRRPPPQIFQIQEPSRRSKHKMNRSRYGKASSTSSSSSSDSDYKMKKGRNRCLPMNFKEKSRGDKKKKTLADTDPMEIDPNIRFDNVGGLDEHVKTLKEMVLLPMMYSEIYDQFKVTPPKGVLFHGPPGTGKTLLARALANECSQGTSKVTFFMRKGADCLNKWVGESERQLRHLFEQAYEKRPSIIFFDELDGLAPVRSHKQDQIHASIVSTLLALMDGLKDRKEIIVIGATNRIDAIDQALRRPGRFDKELLFSLPAVKEREEILKIHVSKWEKQPPPPLITRLAEECDGYCGADLKALCCEAVLHSVRRRYPQIYKSEQKLLIDPTQVMVKEEDFFKAKSGIIPASQRVSRCPGRKISSLLGDLLDSELHRAIKFLAHQFPHVNMTSASECKLLAANVPRPRLLLTGNMHQPHSTHIAPAILHRMEHVSVHSLEMSNLFGSPGLTPEEVCIQMFREASRQIPSVIYLPNVDRWWNRVSDTLKDLLLENLNSIAPKTATLFLATANCELNSEDMPEEIESLFSTFRDEVLEVKNPGREERVKFFSPLFKEKPFELPSTDGQAENELEEVLPLAPPPEPKKLTEKEEEALRRTEEHSLRELRIFLRQTLDKLMKLKSFSIFMNPVDEEEAPDYYQIIENPMDMSTIREKIDRHAYNCAEDFLKDIDLISQNCLEYNSDRQLRAVANNFSDSAKAIIKAEMDTDFEEECQTINVARKKRNFDPQKYLLNYIHVAPEDKKKTNKEKTECETTEIAPIEPIVNGTVEIKTDTENAVAQNSQSTSEVRQKKRRSKWSSGVIHRPRKKRATENKDLDESSVSIDNSLLDSSLTTTPVSKTQKKSNSPMSTSSPCKGSPECPVMKETIKVVDSILTATENSERIAEDSKELKVNKVKLDKLHEHTLEVTDDLPFALLLDLHTKLNRVVESYMDRYDRSNLSNDMEAQIKIFVSMIKQ